MPKKISEFILLTGALLSIVFSSFCLHYIMDFYQNGGGIRVLGNINTLGLLSQNSIVISLFFAIVCSMFEQRKKDG